MTAIDHWLPSWAAEPLSGPDLLRVQALALSALEAEGKVRKTGRGKYATLPLAPTG